MPIGNGGRATDDEARLEIGEHEVRCFARVETRLLVYRVGVKWPGRGPRLRVRASDGLCARAPGLTSVRDPGWFRAGDMMFDGV